MTTVPLSRLASAVLVGVFALVQAGCAKEGCLGGEADGGWDALGTTGDVKLSNAFADVVIANIGTQNCFN
jgi:hypothetical protein